MPERLVHGLPTTPQGGLVLPDAWEPLRSAVATADAVLLGPGMADLDATIAVASRVLEHVASDAIVVIDALAIAALELECASTPSATDSCSRRTPRRSTPSFQTCRPTPDRMTGRSPPPRRRGLW